MPQAIGLAFVFAEELKRALLSIKDLLYFPIKFISEIRDFQSLFSRWDLGLFIVDSEALDYLNEEQTRLLYDLPCPRIVIMKVEDGYFFFPVPQVNAMHNANRVTLQSLAEQMNRYFQPLGRNQQADQRPEFLFLTRNPRMQQILENAKKVAQFDTRVLLLGESGTGKEVLARVIHQHSRRKNRAMVKINCAAIPANLLETEMFGYRKGAFTNAFEDKIGKIQLANGSTLLLDEIGDLELGLQAKLLRVIETGEVDVIGALHPIKVDVRIISATNQSLKKAVQDGRFRKDLFYRLNIVTLHLLPLRDRPEDIPLLFCHFLEEFNRKYNRSIQPPDLNRFREIFDYPWPGNVRELRHFAERVVLQTTGNRVDPDLIRTELAELDVQNCSGEETQGLEHYLMEQERKYITRALVKNNYRIQDTARDLNISRVTLFRKMKKLGIELPPKEGLRGKSASDRKSLV